MYGITFLLLAIFGTIAIIRINDAIKGGRDVVAADAIIESYARANAALMAARQQHQRAYARYVTANGRTLIAEVMMVTDDGTLQLRRRGHRHSVPFTRSADEVFPR
jgi:hypothetical protein